MDHTKLFRFAQVAIEACTRIEKTNDFKKKFRKHKEYDALMESMTPEERMIATEFIGNVNGLRWAIKKAHIERMNSAAYRAIQTMTEDPCDN